MRASHIAMFIFALVAVGVIISTFVDTSTYADFNTARSYAGDEFHVIGKLDTVQPVLYDARENADEFSFYMIDKNHESMKVCCFQAMPYDFRRSEQIVVTGYYTDSLFVATSMLLKCPSKYDDNKQPAAFSQTSFLSDSI